MIRSPKIRCSWKCWIIQIFSNTVSIIQFLYWCNESLDTLYIILTCYILAVWNQLLFLILFKQYAEILHYFVTLLQYHIVKYPYLFYWNWSASDTWCWLRVLEPDILKLSINKIFKIITFRNKLRIKLIPLLRQIHLSFFRNDWLTLHIFQWGISCLIILHTDRTVMHRTLLLLFCSSKRIINLFWFRLLVG